MNSYLRQGDNYQRNQPQSIPSAISPNSESEPTLNLAKTAATALIAKIQPTIKRTSRRTSQNTKVPNKLPRSLLLLPSSIGAPPSSSLYPLSMQLALNGATIMHSPLEDDVGIAADCGFDALELWAAKLDPYLASHTLDDLAATMRDRRIQPWCINSIEDIPFRDH